ncbi:MAG: class I SAM-dependent DNA methyltransferase [Actinomycetota bacterium]
MDEYGPGTYGDRIADVYDEWPRYPHHEEAAAEFLASVAGAGPVLELGIGTGRIALPLAAKGVEVHGIDASKAMVSKLRAKPGGADIPVTMGDFADVDVDGRFSLIFVAFNTFFGLLTQEDQVRCFRNVAAHLTDEGVFVSST